jgi:hypothetical protein
VYFFIIKGYCLKKKSLLEGLLIEIECGSLFFAFVGFKSKMMILLSFFGFFIEKPKKA